MSHQYNYLRNDFRGYQNGKLHHINHQIWSCLLKLDVSFLPLNVTWTSTLLKSSLHNLFFIFLMALLFLGLSQKSMQEFFAKLFPQWTIFAKSFNIYVWMSHKYVFEISISGTQTWIVVGLLYSTSLNLLVFLFTINCMPGETYFNYTTKLLYCFSLDSET